MNYRFHSTQPSFRWEIQFIEVLLIVCLNSIEAKSKIFISRQTHCWWTIFKEEVFVYIWSCLPNNIVSNSIKKGADLVQVTDAVSIQIPSNPKWNHKCICFSGKKGSCRTQSEYFLVQTIFFDLIYFWEK